MAQTLSFVGIFRHDPNQLISVAAINQFLPFFQRLRRTRSESMHLQPSLEIIIGLSKDGLL
ncbi:MAG: hypothetical protein MOB07_17450 [Acidobacteria bacterium]|nr:hypothetical protein [Acidobacteriota bacterium]